MKSYWVSLEEKVEKGNLIASLVDTARDMDLNSRVNRSKDFPNVSYVQLNKKILPFAEVRIHIPETEEYTNTFQIHSGLFPLIGTASTKNVLKYISGLCEYLEGEIEIVVNPFHKNKQKYTIDPSMALQL